MTSSFVRRSHIAASPEAVYAWHARPGAFLRLAPPWEDVRLVRDAPLQNGQRVEFSVPLGPLRQRWIAEYRDVSAGERFTDVQVHGPFRAWSHTHAMLPDPEGCLLEDRIDFTIPLGTIGRALLEKSIKTRLERTFAYRHRLTKQECERERNEEMNVLVTGSRGMVGKELLGLLGTGGHEVIVARRGETGPEGSVAWKPESGFPDPSPLEGLDAVVHLAGENIAAGRWTAERKKRIRDSRIEGTRKLCEDLAGLETPPKTLVCAAAVGFYGSRGDEVLDESSAPGTGFLAELCQGWEDACEPARAAGIRVVNLRFGVILHPREGALKKMLPPFRMGVGGILGNGRQYMPWITLEDAARIVEHALTNPEITGPVNAVAPITPTNREFTKALGKALRRPTIFPLPAFMARLLFGEMAEELLLSSARVVPTALEASGFRYDHPELEPALRELLGKAPKS